MGWRVNADLPEDGLLQNPAQVLDLEKYDLEGLRTDVSQIISLTGTLQSVAVRALGFTAIFSLVVFLIFSGRLSGTGLALFMMVTLLLAALGAVMLAVFFVLRTRVAQTTTASSRVVDLVELIHADYQDFRGGGAQASVRAVGSEIAQHIVLPAVFGFAGRAAILAGPMGILLRPALKLPQQWVENAVVSALDELPEHAVATIEPVSGMTEAARPDVAMNEVGGAASELNAVYVTIQNKLESIVRVLRVGTLGPVGALVCLSLVPLAAVLLLTWLAT